MEKKQVIKMSVVEIHLKKDHSSYFFGNSLIETPDYLALQSVDENGYLGGIYFIKKSAISAVKTNSDEIEDLKNKIIDPFSLKKNSEELLKEFLTQQDIKKLCQENSLIYLETADENYHGKVKSINSKEITLTELDYENHQLTVLLDEVQVFGFKLLEDKLLDEYLNSETSIENSDLVEIDLKNQSPIEQNEFLVGKIIREDEDTIIIESLNDLGQLESVTAIKTSVIEKIVKKDDYLNYIEFLKQWQENNQSYDLKKIQEGLKKLDLKNSFQADSPIIDLVK
ncbi:hypothetical protein FP435_01545 [Lactobacillus sp. PV037]|uniref:hypothetical protein n=1 Tax=unclassified Lactobacillus TaxID=2620435 RepID=UPI00223FFA60|nr:MULTISPECIES: hypothetical protein [unclassified Lactobacillus]QNQ82676.1 hypothetical protein FP433_06265 [Lactobacillus sp. PV012]QNQ83206.1 hypothetical protein FP435_01545 [Lactobacillus sp. PV037]